MWWLSTELGQHGVEFALLGRQVFLQLDLNLVMGFLRLIPVLFRHPKHQMTGSFCLENSALKLGELDCDFAVLFILYELDQGKFLLHAVHSVHSVGEEQEGYMDSMLSTRISHTCIEDSFVAEINKLGLVDGRVVLLKLMPFLSLDEPLCKLFFICFLLGVGDVYICAVD